MKRVMFFIGFLVFAACQDEGVDSGDLGNVGPSRGHTPIVVAVDAGISDARGVPDVLKSSDLQLEIQVQSLDTLPSQDTLNLDAMTRAERCATTQPAIYTYGWTTACADLADWAIKNPNRAGDTTLPVQRGINEDCAWTYCVLTK